MSRFWSRNKRNAVVAASVALVGLLAYVVYEVYQESSKTYSSDDEDDDSQQQQQQQIADNSSDIEDIIHIPQHLDQPQSSDEDRFSQAISPTAGNILNQQQNTNNSPRKSLAISARGIIFDSLDSSDKWSSHIHIRKDAIYNLVQMTRLYHVYLIIVTRPEPEHQQEILKALAKAGIIALPEQAPEVSESTVWVNKHDSDDSLSSSNQSSHFDEIPSSAISSILNTPSSPGILPVSNILFCQTEEGKVHLARHLLTANHHRNLASKSAASGYAGYVDTNRDVVARLSRVLHSVILVAPSPEDSNGCIIGHGDTPGSSTAFSSANLQAANGESSTSGPADLASSVEVVSNIAQSSLYHA
ncbi:hypothetical protein IWW36_001821 [Coemansia brasiliensis]|uniref:Uncharacterized protein n=1 Tax=Coemansia brasiliensis TaxID=2650707 RepID=A0A9W8I8D3_9FUNG|nr:hypothetical protein IWW36_001821 [Coemansia brasiliensis]